MREFLYCQECNAPNCRYNRECISCGKTLKKKLEYVYIEPTYVRRHDFIEMYNQLNVEQRAA